MLEPPTGSFSSHPVFIMLAGVTVLGVGYHAQSLDHGNRGLGVGAMNLLATGHHGKLYI